MQYQKPKTYEFHGSNYVADIGRQAPRLYRVKWFFKNLYYGFYYGYPSCCVWYFSKHAYLGIPVAAYDYVMKGKDHSLERVVCDKCYRKMKMNDLYKAVFDADVDRAMPPLFSGFTNIKDL